MELGIMEVWEDSEQFREVQTFLSAVIRGDSATVSEIISAGINQEASQVELES